MKRRDYLAESRALLSQYRAAVAGGERWDVEAFEREREHVRGYFASTFTGRREAMANVRAEQLDETIGAVHLARFGGLDRCGWFLRRGVWRYVERVGYGVRWCARCQVHFDALVMPCYCGR